MYPTLYSSRHSKEERWLVAMERSGRRVTGPSKRVRSSFMTQGLQGGSVFVCHAIMMMMRNNSVSVDDNKIGVAMLS